MKRVGLLLMSCLLLVGCVSAEQKEEQKPCPRCTFINERIEAAEQFMPGYWVKQQTQDLEPVVDEHGDPIHSAEYEGHHRWILVRDALNKAEGKDE